MRFAVLPAAGKSSRMGRPKLALRLGERTILEHVLTALRHAEVAYAVVVLGPHVRELAPLVHEAGANVCQLNEETSGMRESVEHGLRWLEERFQPHPEDAWLLVPADHPTLAPAVIRQLEQARGNHPEHSIFVPTFQGRRGHPLALAWKHVEGIRAYAAGEGLNRYVRQNSAQVCEVPVDDETIHWDIDTPQDYERLRCHWLDARMISSR